MTKHEIATLACRLLGIYLVIQAIPQMGYWISLVLTKWLLSTPIGFPEPVSYVLVQHGAVPITLMLIGAIFVWKFAPRLATAMVGPVEDTEGPTRLGARDLSIAAFSVLGLFILSEAVPKFLGILIGNFFMDNGYSYANGLRLHGVQLGIELIRVSIGFYLVFGAVRLTGWLSGIREVAMTEPVERPG